MAEHVVGVHVDAVAGVALVLPAGGLAAVAAVGYRRRTRCMHTSTAPTQHPNTTNNADRATAWFLFGCMARLTSNK